MCWHWTPRHRELSAFVSARISRFWGRPSSGGRACNNTHKAPPGTLDCVYSSGKLALHAFHYRFCAVLFCCFGSGLMRCHVFLFVFVVQWKCVTVFVGGLCFARPPGYSPMSSASSSSFYSQMLSCIRKSTPLILSSAPVQSQRLRVNLCGETPLFIFCFLHWMDASLARRYVVARQVQCQNVEGKVGNSTGSRNRDAKQK